MGALPGSSRGSGGAPSPARQPGLLRARDTQRDGPGGAAERLRTAQTGAARQAAAAPVPRAALVLLSDPASGILGRKARPPHAAPAAPDHRIAQGASGAGRRPRAGV